MICDYIREFYAKETGIYDISALPDRGDVYDNYVHSGVLTDPSDAEEKLMSKACLLCHSENTFEFIRSDNTF